MSTLKIKRENGKIFCPLADSWHIETPEEKVRQEYIKILVTVHGKKVAKSCYSVHSSMRASNIISPEGKVTGSLSAVISSKCGRKRFRQFLQP